MKDQLVLNHKIERYCLMCKISRLNCIFYMTVSCYMSIPFVKHYYYVQKYQQVEK